MSATYDEMREAMARAVRFRLHGHDEADAALAAARAVGWVMVPVEAPRWLITTMDTAFNAETFRIGCGADPMRRAYEAMLAASPAMQESER